VIIEPGVHVQLGQGAQLIVDDASSTLPGWLDANGTLTAPVVFEPDGAGVRFDYVKVGGQSQTSSLHYVEVRGGGSNLMTVGHAMLELTGNVPYLLDHVNMIDSLQFGLYMAHRNRIDPASDGLYFDKTTSGPINFDDGMALKGFPTIQVGCDPGPSNTVAAGDITETMTWASQPVPFHMKASLAVNPNGTTPTVLTLAAPNTLLFDAQGNVLIGPNQSTPANLVADGAITFDAADPQKGWGGFFLGGTMASATIVRGGTIAHGGHGTNAIFAAVSMNIQTPNVWPTIENETIRDVDGLPGSAALTTACIAHFAPCGEPPGKPDYAGSGNVFMGCSTGFDDTCP
jgi:hypothetical protein